MVVSNRRDCTTLARAANAEVDVLQVGTVLIQACRIGTASTVAAAVQLDTSSLDLILTFVGLSYCVTTTTSPRKSSAQHDPASLSPLDQYFDGP